MWRRDRYLLWWTVLILGVLLGSGVLSAHDEVRTAVADGVRGVQPTGGAEVAARSAP